MATTQLQSELSRRLTEDRFGEEREHLAVLQRRGISTTDELLGRWSTLPTSDRAVAARVMGLLRLRKATPLLVASLDSDDLAEATEAAKALIQLDSPSALRGVRQAAASRRPSLAAVYALSFIGSGEDSELLLRLAADTSQEPEVRAQAVEGAAYVLDGSDRRRSLYRSAVKALIALGTDDRVEVRYSVAFALGYLRATSGTSILRRLKRDDGLWPGYGTVADAASEALSRMPPARRGSRAAPGSKKPGSRKR